MQITFHSRQYASARGIRRSAIHQNLLERGACFGEVAGWERANWFLPAELVSEGNTPGINIHGDGKIGLILRLKSTCSATKSKFLT